MYKRQAIIPGVFGTILLLLAFYAFSIFPINLAGILFIFLGLLLFILDLLVTPGIGVLTAGGAVALFFGSLMPVSYTHLDVYKRQDIRSAFRRI